MPADGGYPVLGMLAASEPSVLPGAGTVGDPYLLATPEEFGFVARNPDASHRMVDDVDLAVIWACSTQFHRMRR
jgi:hypothetical protein